MHHIKSTINYIGLAFTLIALVFFSLELYNYDFSVPFNYSGDSVILLMYIKAVAQNGWPNEIYQLSAPFSYPGASFPILTSIDWLIVKTMTLLTSEPGHLINGFWMLSIVFTAWAANFASHQLGASKSIAFGAGVLYSLLPFAWIRNVGHLNLVYYLVPLLCLIAVISLDEKVYLRNRKLAITIGLIACALQGFNYIYYSFFTAILLGISALLAYNKKTTLQGIRLPMAAICIIISSTALNLSQAYISWRTNGPAPEMEYKHIAESEIYGAKIRKMLAPHTDNVIFPFSTFGKKEIQANFPNENENTTARLGLFGALGLLLIIYYTLSKKSLSISMNACATLGVATLLIITVGGFGTIINMLSTPDIRAYNRFSVHLSFFAIVFAGLWIQRLIEASTGRTRFLFYVLGFTLVSLSIYDQLLDRRWMLGTQSRDTIRTNEERRVVKKLESLADQESAVLQLPFTGFPPLAIIHKMESYDHARPFIWSNHLKWSWPSFSQQHRSWQNRMTSLEGQDLIRASIISGFKYIWIDRHGYKDNANNLAKSISQNGVQELNLGSERFLVFDLSKATQKLQENLSKEEIEMNRKSLFENPLIDQ